MRLSALAGNMPAVVPAPVKRRLLATTLLQQVSRDPSALLQAYIFSVLGAGLGFGSYVFWSYRLPTFMDTTRWLVALERGIFLGVFAGFGVFVTRFVIHRLTSLPLGPRVIAGIISGSLALLVAFLGYDVLFLDILPTGWLLPAGCLMVAATFGLSAAMVRRLWLQMGLCAAGAVLAFALTWAGYVQTFMTPLLYFEDDWAWPQMLVAVLLAAVPPAILGNLGALSGGPD